MNIRIATAWAFALGAAAISHEQSDRAKRERLITAGFEPKTSPPQEWSDFIKREIGRYGKVIREAKLEVQP